MIKSILHKENGQDGKNSIDAITANIKGEDIKELYILLRHNIGKAFPDGQIHSRAWNSDWNEPCKFLARYLGFDTVRDLIEDFGFSTGESTSDGSPAGFDTLPYEATVKESIKDAVSRLMKRGIYEGRRYPLFAILGIILAMLVLSGIVIGVISLILKIAIGAKIVLMAVC